VTPDDLGSLCFKLIVSVPGGGMEDPMHIIAAIVAEPETQRAGTGATGRAAAFVRSLPASVSRRGATTWVGDVGKAAAEWMVAVQLPKSEPEKADYMLENAEIDMALTNLLELWFEWVLHDMPNKPKK
jgi:hypothetical protein